MVDDQDKLTRLDISRSMDVKTEYKEEDSMKTDDVNKELDFMEWLLDELRDMVVEDEVIAMVMGEMRNTQATIEEESVPEVERQIAYPHHYGIVHTPLLRPATIPEKGVELGCEIGLHTAGGQEAGMKSPWMQKS